MEEAVRLARALEGLVGARDGALVGVQLAREQLPPAARVVDRRVASEPEDLHGKGDVGAREDARALILADPMSRGGGRRGRRRPMVARRRRRGGGALAVHARRVEERLLLVELALRARGWLTHRTTG